MIRQFGLAIQFGNSVRQFSLAKQFNLTANGFGGRATLVSGGLVACQALFAVEFYTKWYLTTKEREIWAG
jgi:hypothetical protein